MRQKIKKHKLSYTQNGIRKNYTTTQSFIIDILNDEKLIAIAVNSNVEDYMFINNILDKLSYNRTKRLLPNDVIIHSFKIKNRWVKFYIKDTLYEGEFEAVYTDKQSESPSKPNPNWIKELKMVMNINIFYLKICQVSFS